MTSSHPVIPSNDQSIDQKQMVVFLVVIISLRKRTTTMLTTTILTSTRISTRTRTWKTMKRAEIEDLSGCNARLEKIRAR